MTENIHAYFPLLNFPFCRKRVIFWAHATPFLCAPPYVCKKETKTIIRYLLATGGLKKFLEYLFYQFCLLTLKGRTIIASPGLTSALRNRGFFRLFRFIDFQHHSMIYEFSYSRRKSFDAIYLARFIPGKGLANCLQIWRMVTKELPKAKLLVIGPPKELVATISKKLDISDNVIAMGEVNEKRKSKFLRSSKLLIYPSILDSYAHVISEALSNGLPVICYDITPFKENFSNLSPVIKVEFRNYQKAASFVIKLLTDPNYYETLSKEALRFSKITFQPRNVVTRFLRILHEIS